MHLQCKSYKKNNFSFTTDTERELVKLREAANEDNLSQEIEDKIVGIESEIRALKDALYQKDKALVLDLIENDIVSRYYFEEGKIIQQLENDSEVSKAISLLKNKSEYESILK